MPVLAATNIYFAHGDTIILDGVSLSIEANDRIGLVGRNGTGKSTLMKVLGGLVKPLKGDVTLQKGCRVGYLQQDPNLDPEDTLRDAAERAFDELHAAHEEQHRIYDEMAHAQGPELEKLLRKQSAVEARIESLGGYAIDHKIEEVLHGLGFTDAQFQLKVRQLSGGQRGRLALARLLLEQPDVLLLDEPTNHLDIEGRLWLEHFLTEEYKGAVLMVSHDRYLLDNVVTRIIETEQCRLIDYPGNYGQFREIRAQRRLTMLRAYEAEQHKWKKEEAFIRRYKAGQRAKQARGRQSKLDRAKESSTLERPMELDTFGFTLPRAPRSGDIVVALREASKKYQREDGGDKVLFHTLSLSIGRGERWGILGPNGAGKTTLVRCALGELPIDSGKLQLGSSLAIGYFRQTHEELKADETVVRYLQGVILREAPQAALSEQQARDLAGAFLFSGEDQEKKLGVMSGGERTRAVLAGLLASAKNLIILDEPTNHLDIESAERLEDALDLEGGFDGTLILISHDRALIDATCDHLIVLDGQGGASVFHGNYTEWAEKEKIRKREEAARAAEEQSRREEQERRRREAEERKKSEAARTARQAGPGNGRQPSTNALARMKTEQIEARIEKIEARVRQIDVELSDPDVWRNHSRGESLSNERNALAAELEPLEFEWSRRAAEEQ
ncbi:MAG: ABC-F family ATP-binding cassette domain-containing protein [Phycisphaerales bacterium]